MIKIDKVKVYTDDETKYLHRIGTEDYGKRMVLLKGETAECFEEVDEKPATTKAERDDMTARLIRERYTESEEFAIQRKMINAMAAPALMSDADESQAEKALNEYAEYNRYVEECKAGAEAAVIAERERRWQEAEKREEE